MADDNTEQYNEEPAVTEQPQVEINETNENNENDNNNDYEQPQANDNIQQELQTRTTETNDPTPNQTGQEPQNYEIPKDTQPETVIVSTIETDQNENYNNTDKSEGDNNEEKDTEPEKRLDLYDADGDGVADDEMFEGSTHGFAVHFERKRNIDGIIIAYFVFLMQFVLYLVCAAQVMGDLSGSEFVIPVNVRYGKKCTEPANLGTIVCIDDNYWISIELNFCLKESTVITIQDSIRYLICLKQL